MIYVQTTTGQSKGMPAMDTLNSSAVGYATDTGIVTYYRNAPKYGLRYKTSDDLVYNFDLIQSQIKDMYPQISCNDFIENSDTLDGEGYRTAYFTNPITLIGINCRNDRWQTHCHGTRAVILQCTDTHGCHSSRQRHGIR